MLRPRQNYVTHKVLHLHNVLIETSVVVTQSWT